MVTVFIDIEAAFDNLWWPAIIAKIIKAECSTPLVKLIKSYFKNREMLVKSKNEKINRYYAKTMPAGIRSWSYCLLLVRGHFFRKVSKRNELTGRGNNCLCR